MKTPAKQNGIVLVTVLIFLVVLMLLGLGALATSQLQIRMSHNLANQIQTFQATEAGLRLGEKQLPAISSCFLPLPLPKEQNKNPWITQSTHCNLTFANIAVHYLIEQLPGNPCVVSSANQKAIGQVYRITAWTDVTDTAPIILQSMYALAGTTPCISEEQIVPAGRLAWREMD